MGSNARLIVQVHITQSRILGIHYYARGYQIGPKKTEAIINLERAKDKKYAMQFLGMVQFYRSLWPKRSEILEPLTELTKGGPTNISPPNGL